MFRRLVVERLPLRSRLAPKRPQDAQDPRISPCVDQRPTGTLLESLRQ